MPAGSGDGGTVSAETEKWGQDQPEMSSTPRKGVLTLFYRQRVQCWGVRLKNDGRSALRENLPQYPRPILKQPETGRRKNRLCTIDRQHQWTGWCWRSSLVLAAERQDTQRFQGFWCVRGYFKVPEKNISKSKKEICYQILILFTKSKNLLLTNTYS